MSAEEKVRFSFVSAKFRTSEPSFPRNRLLGQLFRFYSQSQSLNMKTFEKDLIQDLFVSVRLGKVFLTPNATFVI